MGVIILSLLPIPDQMNLTAQWLHLFLLFYSGHELEMNLDFQSLDQIIFEHKVKRLNV
jgi:hypothetical protein